MLHLKAGQNQKLKSNVVFIVLLYTMTTVHGFKPPMTHNNNICVHNIKTDTQNYTNSNVLQILL